MIRYEEIKNNKKRLLALTGLTRREFESLLEAFTEIRIARDEILIKQSDQKRQRQPGGGRKPILDSDEQKLLFALMYQKSYPTQELLGSMFDMSQSRCNYWIHEVLPMLRESLDRLDVLPIREPEALAKQLTQQEAPVLIIDGTERRRQRPQNPERQTVHYSGKKKTHTDKNILISDAKTKRVDYLSQTYPGSAHDKKIADHEAIQYSSQTILYKDTGFQGYEPSVALTLQPKKTKKWRTQTQ